MIAVVTEFEQCPAYLAGASIEWIAKVEEDPFARRAIQFAHQWDVKQHNPALLHDLEGALGSALLLSCIFSRWDGNHPSKQRAAECEAMFTYMPLGSGRAIVPGLSGIIPTPFNAFWNTHIKYNIVEKLARTFGSQSGAMYLTCHEERCAEYSERTGSLESRARESIIACSEPMRRN